MPCLRLLLSAALVLALSGCSRRSPSPAPPDAAAPAPTLGPLLPPPHPWTFARVRVDTGLALPEGCRLRAPTSRATIGPLARFVAEPRTLGGLVVADAEGNPPRLTGVAALTLDPEGATRAPSSLPWLDAGSLPRLARAGTRWVAAIDGPGAGVFSRVLLWRGDGVEVVGEGDGFEAADLACFAARPDDARCVLLTTRQLTVAGTGATAWLGSPADPPSRWRSVEILAAAGGDARPLAVAGEDTVAVSEKGSVVFHAVTGGAAREVARLSAGHGALDAAMLGRPVALGLTSQVDDDGCPRDGKPGIRLARDGAAPVDFALPAPPARAALRRLARGGLAVWIAPAGCRVPRSVVYAVVLDDAGAPVGSPIPVGDAAGFGVAASGADVDLWLADAGAVTWIRATCAPR